MARVTGFKKIDKKLKRLATTGSKRIGQAMVSSLMTEVSKGIRKAIPPKQRSVKKTLGRKLKKNPETGMHEGKVGLGVGKRTKSKKQRDPKKPGVGISKQNVHWFILGTDHRFTQNAEYTGKMPEAPPWVKTGYYASKTIAARKSREAGRRKLLQEVRR